MDILLYIGVFSLVTAFIMLILDCKYNISDRRKGGWYSTTGTLCLLGGIGLFTIFAVLELSLWVVT